MRVLLDTCVLSELNRLSGSDNVRQTVSEKETFLSAISMGEIAKGEALLDFGPRQRNLLSWLTGLETHFTETILPINTKIALTWGEFTARAQRQELTVHL